MTKCCPSTDNLEFHCPVQGHTHTLAGKQNSSVLVLYPRTVLQVLTNALGWYANNHNALYMRGFCYNFNHALLPAGI